MNRPVTWMSRQLDRVLSMLVDLSKTTQTSLVIVTHDRRVAAQTEQLFELCHGQLTNFH